MINWLPLGNFERIKSIHCTTDTNDAAEDNSMMVLLLHQLLLLSCHTLGRTCNSSTEPTFITFVSVDNTFYAFWVLCTAGTRIQHCKNILKCSTCLLNTTKCHFHKYFSFSCKTDWNGIDIHNKQEILFFQEISIHQTNTNICFKCPLLEAVLIVLNFYCFPVKSKSEDFVLTRKQPKGSTAFGFRTETMRASFLGL